MIQKILLATDGSDAARRAAEWAGDLAVHYDAEVFVVHVIASRKVPEALRRMAEIEHLVEPTRQGRATAVVGPAVLAEADPDARLIAAVAEKILRDAEPCCGREA